MWSQNFFTPCWYVMTKSAQLTAQPTSADIAPALPESQMVPKPGPKVMNSFMAGAGGVQELVFKNKAILEAGECEW